MMMMVMVLVMVLVLVMMMSHGGMWGAQCYRHDRNIAGCVSSSGGWA